MLFNSYVFLFAFLPGTLAACFLAGRWRRGLGGPVLSVCSLAFYTWWYPPNLAMLMLSTGVNFALGLAIAGLANPRTRRATLVAGIVFNLAFIGYFKYATFAISNANALFGASWVVDDIILPLGISFFTFQKIAYLADVYRGLRPERSPLRFLLFVSFFPQLIAGPIVHYTELAPQFDSPRFLRFDRHDVALGLSLFSVGLVKKVVLADTAALFVTPIFDAADHGGHPDFLSAWGATLAYTFQLYFDFSGYSDMAIGLACLFGVSLPQNFNSPYKAQSIADFWRRWHMTLSRFLRDFLYIPLGGNRQGGARQLVNLALTMLLGGLWHGANWNFVIWGGLHGIYLAINHAWRGAAPERPPSRLRAIVAWALTFFAVVISWVFFRAVTFDGSLNMLAGMAMLNGLALPAPLAAWSGWHVLDGIVAVGPATRSTFDLFANFFWVALLAGIAFFAPNSEELFGRARHADRIGAVSPPVFTYPRAVACGLLLALGLSVLSQPSEFLYFQF
jgi:alginate O-acetyltransferase complex protein AlgI